MLMAEFVLFQQKNHIAYVTINRPERMNALGQEVRKGLIDAFMKVRYEPSIRVAIITGAGDKAFSAGGDLKEHKELNANQTYLKFRLNIGLQNRKRDDSRKDAKRAKFGETGKYFFFAPLASWRKKIF
jgi:enoyl-CoA hydratase/carnithine racemase